MPYGKAGLALAFVATLVACSPEPRYYVASGITSASAFAVDGPGIPGKYLVSFLEPGPTGPAVKSETFDTSMDGTALNLRDADGNACAPWTFKQISDRTLTVSNGVETTRYVSGPKNAYDEATQNLVATAQAFKGAPGAIIDDWKPRCKFYALLQAALTSARQTKFDSIRGSLNSTNGRGHFIYTVKDVTIPRSVSNCYLLVDPKDRELFCRLISQNAPNPWAAEFAQEIWRSLPASYKIQPCRNGDASMAYCKTWKGNNTSDPSVEFLSLRADGGSYAFILMVRIAV